MSAAGGSLANLTKLTTCVVDPRLPQRGLCGHRAAAAERPRGQHRPCRCRAAAPEMIVQIDAEAAIPAAAPRYTRPYTFDSWHGQGFPWQGSMVLATDDEFFVRGQTGANLDHTGSRKGPQPRRCGRAGRPGDDQPGDHSPRGRRAPEDICKITVYIGDRAYRSAIYPVIGKHLASVRPVSTGIITTGFARPDILFELDTVVVRKQSRRAAPARASLSFECCALWPPGQRLDCELSSPSSRVAGDPARPDRRRFVNEGHRRRGKARADRRCAMSRCCCRGRREPRRLVRRRLRHRPRVSRRRQRTVLRGWATPRRFTSVLVKGLRQPESSLMRSTSWRSDSRVTFPSWRSADRHCSGASPRRRWRSVRAACFAVAIARR